jgi:hypothetical protein
MKFDHIKWMIKLTRDNIKRFSLQSYSGKSFKITLSKAKRTCPVIVHNILKLLFHLKKNIIGKYSCGE